MLTISQRGLAADTVAKFGATRGKIARKLAEIQLHKAYHDDVDEPFRPLVGNLAWLANHIRPDTLNVVRPAVRCFAAGKGSHSGVTLNAMIHMAPTSACGITVQDRIYE